MNLDEIMNKSKLLVDGAKIAYLGTNGNDGYPNIKAMFKMENEGLKTIWFSTNTSSRRVAQLQKSHKVCVYFTDEGKGLMLIGNIEILQDEHSKKRLWRDGFERYYKSGVSDPDYTVLRFEAKSGNYYHALNNTNFDL